MTEVCSRYDHEKGFLPYTIKIQVIFTFLSEPRGKEERERTGSFRSYEVKGALFEDQGIIEVKSECGE